MNRNRGFTLIELVVVMLVIALLAAIAVPSYQNMKREARIAQLKAVGAAIMSAVNIQHAAAVAQDKTDPTGTIQVKNNLGVVVPQLVVHGWPDFTDATAANKSAIQFLEIGQGVNSSAIVLPCTTATTNYCLADGGSVISDTCRLNFINATSTAVMPYFSLITTGC